jgi:NADH:ubiquinone oxidoreductase subunit F (NADH-binding)
MSATAAAPRRRSVPDPHELPRLLAGARVGQGPVSLEEHVERHGVLPKEISRGEAARLIDLVEASGLRGRGGAGFPAGRKLRAVAERGRRTVVVANGSEGEPASAKDKVLLRRVPHLVLDGAALAAATVGAAEAFVVVGETAERERLALEDAVAERERRRLDGVAFRVVRIPDRFVAGEETALVNFLNGGPAKPTFTPPRPFERGVGGLPTLVQNVETLSHLALVARYGPAWFRGLGTEQQPGTALVTLDGAVGRPGVHEIPIGLPLRDLVEQAGGVSAPISAFLVGGYFGTWVAVRDAVELTLSDAGLAPAGASLGAGTIVALPAGTCGVLETARVARYLAGESARQCGPCVHGLDAIATAVEHLAARKKRRRGGGGGDLARWTAQVKGRGACRHPDGAARLVESALVVFADELARHARGGCTGDGRPLLRLPEARR